MLLETANACLFEVVCSSETKTLEYSKCLLHLVNFSFESVYNSETDFTVQQNLASSNFTCIKLYCYKLRL